MPAERHGYFAWPGLRSVERATYTLTRGAAPGVAVLTCLPQPGVPYASRGDLEIGDGVRRVILRDCKVVGVRETQDENGRAWQVSISDRRWRWRDCGAVSLWGNQLDPNGKFIPWTVVSPTEMAEWCLRHAGEARYKIDLPPGLTTAAAAGVTEFLPTGVNFPPTGTNPPVDWVAMKPMQALESLAEQFGRVLAYQWRTDGVLVAEVGTGGAVPPGSVYQRSPGVSDPDTPDGVVVVGAPTRFQADFELQAVGEEWDGRVLPIDQLSYAPRSAGAFHEWKVEGEYDPDFAYYVTVQTDPEEPGFTAVDDISSTGSVDMEDVYTALAAQINEHAKTFKHVTASATATELTVRAKVKGFRFDVAVKTHYQTFPVPDPPPAAPPWKATLVRTGASGRADWGRCWPPHYPGVRATDRLTLGEARAKAAKSVWKWYQLTGRDIAGKGETVVPGYGPVPRHRIVLLDSQVEQIVPEAPDFAVRDRLGNPLVQNFYNGLSKDRPAECRGSVAKRVAPGFVYLFDKLKGVNTGADERVQVPFTVDAQYWTVKFSAPVYRLGAAAALTEAPIRLRAACHVRDAASGALVRYQHTVMFAGAGGKNLAFERHDDVQLNVFPTYADNRPVLVRVMEADPVLRAGYYAAGAQLRYVPKAALALGYNGIEEVELDGSITQITWTVGEGGCETQVSVNHEHNTAIPPYPARRRAELLAAAVAPGGFLGQIGDRSPALPVPFRRPQ
mgnify:CR=1 FL=1